MLGSLCKNDQSQDQREMKALFLSLLGNFQKQRLVCFKSASKSSGGAGKHARILGVTGEN